MDKWNDSYYKKYYPNPEVKETFIDITHNAVGELCRMFYNPETKSYRLEPIKRK